MLSGPENREGPNKSEKRPQSNIASQLGRAALDANRRSTLGNAAGSQAVKNTVKDQKKGK